MGNVINKMKNKIESLYYKLKDLSIRRFWDRVSIWLSYWKVSKQIYDFDYQGILELEYHQLQRMIKSISKYQNHVDWERDVERMQTMSRLLEIILDKVDWWDIGVDWKNTDVVEEIQRPHKYIIHPYINTHNANRFFAPRAIELLKDNEDLFKIDVRETKVWYLYNEFRKQWLRTFWD